jgi:hypothetical protein
MATIERETVTELRPMPAEGLVRVTVRVVASGDEGKRPWAFVIVKCLPGAAWWSLPDSRTLRRLVDVALDGTGLRRAEPRFDGQRFPSEWRFHYPLA